MTRRTIFSLTIATIMTISVLFAGTAIAEQAGTAPGTIRLFVSDDGLSTETPTEDAYKTRSTLSTATTPGAGFRVAHGSISAEHDFEITGVPGAVFWLRSDQAAVVTSMSVYIYVNGASLGTGTYGASTATIGTSPAAFRVGLPGQGASISDGDTIEFHLTFFGTGVDGTPANVQLVYGSSAQPSGLTFAVDDVGGWPNHGTPTGLWLADDALSFDAPTDDADHVRTADISSFGSSTAWTWGSVETTSDMVFGAPATMQVTIKPNGPGGAVRGFSAFLDIDGSAYSGTVGTIRSTSTGGAITFRFVFDVTGVEVPAGTDLTVRFQLWTTSDGGAAPWQFFYGSTGTPSGITIPVIGGAATEPALSSLLLGVDATSSEIQSGATATLAVTASNKGAENATINISVESNLTTAIDGNTSLSLGAGQNATFNVTVTADAVAGTVENITIRASIDGVEMANVTVSVTVLAAAEAAPDGSVDEVNATEDAVPAGDDEGGNVPGFGAAWIVVALIGAAMLAGRRRRDS